jgi:putative transposase
MFYHVFNRGNNKQSIFPRHENYYFFLKKIKELSSYCNIVAYCLMPSHYHLLIYTGKEDHRMLQNGNMQVLERKLGTLQSSYTRAINNQMKRTGSLFQAKLKVLELDELHSAICFHYIHQNPVKAGLCNQFHEWPFSSYNEYAGVQPNGLCNKSVAVHLLKIETDTELFVRQAREIAVNDKVLLRITKS